MRTMQTILVFIALAVLGSGIAWIRHAFVQAGKYEGEHAARQKIESEHAEYVRLDTEEDGKRDKASQGYQDELATLRADNLARPVPVVRLCQPAARSLPAREAPAERPSATPAPAAVLPAGTGQAAEPRDIGPGLAALMDRADALSAQLRAILQYEGQ